ncbi:RNA pol II accessory factor, Cdc73 family-domain-containing protein [Phlebopus sp. FC_14]|nr:RNA pol II accessory factor, Cdc73 family-domain-containing protein [Phlebopus sp. FC_14]
MEPGISRKEALELVPKWSITYLNHNGPTTSLFNAGDLSLGRSLSLPKLSPMQYTKPSVSDASSPTDLYTLEAIYLAWLLSDAPGAEYMKQARESGLAIDFVSVTERKNMVEWLEDKAQDGERIKPLALAESTTSPAMSSHAGMVSAGPLATPKRTTHDTQDAEVVKRIKHNKKLKENKPGPVSTPTPSVGPPMQAHKARGKYLTALAENMSPILMISSSPTALITMYNVKRFEPSTVRKRTTASDNARAGDLLHIDRWRHSTAIFIVDSTDALQKFGADSWERVNGVMTAGQAWQFRPYQWSQPRTLFHHVKGIFVTWANDPPNAKIKDCNVTELKIDPHRRHADKSVVAHFWKLIDDWTLANKSWLLKS